MSAEIITKDDLQMFRIQLLDDLKKMIGTQPKNEDVSEWIKSSEARKILKSVTWNAAELRISGKLNPVKVSGTWRYSLAEVNGLFNGK